MALHDDLMEAFGSSYTNAPVQRLHRFAFVPENMLEKLKGEALTEEWGAHLFALRKYLAVHVPWAIEQERYTVGNDQLYVTAGNLQTRYGTPLFLVFQRIHEPGKSPWRLVATGSEISAPELPTAPEIPVAPELERGAEIVMIHDHILGDNTERVAFLANTPHVAQMCAVAGSIQWSLNRRLHLNNWYFGRMNYIVPLYLQSRENITRSPDLIAPIQVSPGSLVVRTLLEPHMAYPNARVAVRRHDELPAWLLEAWTGYVEAGGEVLEDEEPVETVAQ